jgi:two-component system, NtrC family, C4-dicarboxylate transport response regulator DctD
MTQQPEILFIDDEQAVRLATSQTLELSGYRVTALSDAKSALSKIDMNFAGIVISDVKMPGMDGLEFTRYIVKIDPELPVILISAHGDISMAVKAMHQGAYDFLEKPVHPDRMLEVVARAVEKRKLVMENRTLKNILSDNKKIENILIGKSSQMVQLRQKIKSIANTQVDVLIIGETGSGKELVAKCLHDHSNNSSGPFVALNCGALPESMIESELFGHEAGAFTGAQELRIGKIEHANKGTLFLDEIESMPLALQVKLLRVLQERKVERLGSNQLISVQFRVIAAAKVDLLHLAQQQNFRLDLYYRLAVVRLKIPPLRQRHGDIILLFYHFVHKAAKKYKKVLPDLNGQIVAELSNHHWPGNVRELKAKADRFVLGMDWSDSADMDNQTLNPQFIKNHASLQSQMADYEKSLIENALQLNNGHPTKAASLLNIPRKTLYLRMQKYKINKENFH